MSDRVCVSFREVLSEDLEKKDGWILVENGIISHIDQKMPENCQTIIDFSSFTLVPGFIDIHTHGFKGVDSVTSSEDQMHEWARGILEHGTTTIVPTSVSSSYQDLESFVVKAGYTINSKRADEAQIAGIRMEGPYINSEEKGAQNPHFIRKPDISELKHLFEASGGNLKVIDIAPELDPTGEFLQEARALGITVSAGHTQADFEIATRAFGTGVHLVTHFFNGMPLLHHRNVGIIGAALLNEEVKVELIGDLKHVSRQAIELLVKVKGFRNIAMVTDSISATDMDGGAYKLGNLDVDVRNGACYIMGTDTLAGSLLTLDRALKNMIGIGYRLSDVIPSLTSVPAGILRFNGIGRIREGYRANIAVLDEKLKVVATIMNGKIVYEAD